MSEDALAGAVDVGSAGSDRYALDPLYAHALGVRPHRKLVPRTRIEYTRRVSLYLAWLREADPAHVDALTTASGRDAAVEAYLQSLKQRGRTASTWNVTLAALNSYYEHLELGPAQVAPAPIKRVVTRPLTVDEQSRLIATAQARPAHTRLFRIRKVRNMALVMLLLYGGLRESEAADLDDDDLVLTGARRIVWVPGPGGRRRQVHLPRRAAVALAAWRSERAVLLGDLRIKPFFLAGDNDEGDSDLRRLSQRQIEDIVRDLGREAGLCEGEGIAPGALRATHAQHVIAEEPDLARVASRLGQVKPDLPQIHTLRATPLQQHPGRRHAVPRDDEYPQLALDF
ncbi:tyrosine-type recombinase/integrase [Nocardia sp. 2]|uniref:Tyrosine-type recombinase/integrase n=1 Tax=Nocardia acididurans TaxID=2802282 RepID=A0ABS1MI06_9NOCA|nr:tyrosine-type recombinase/integrase [Nocardia acididurans]MBL1080300.1 tyrosine-type recombinase/integrase [Nocardia acididurans]